MLVCSVHTRVSIFLAPANQSISFRVNKQRSKRQDHGGSMGRDAAAPTRDDHCLRLSFSSQHNTFRFHAIGRGWSSSFSWRKRVVWSGAAQGSEGTNVKPRHVHTYALQAVKKECKNLPLPEACSSRRRRERVCLKRGEKRERSEKEEHHSWG
jgi:hypothetical protein